MLKIDARMPYNSPSLLAVANNSSMLLSFYLYKSDPKEKDKDRYHIQVFTLINGMASVLA